MNTALTIAIFAPVAYRVFRFIRTVPATRGA